MSIHDFLKKITGKYTRIKDISSYNIPEYIQLKEIKSGFLLKFSAYDSDKIKIKSENFEVSEIHENIYLLNGDNISIILRENDQKIYGTGFSSIINDDQKISFTSTYEFIIDNKTNKCIEYKNIINLSNGQSYVSHFRKN